MFPSQCRDMLYLLLGKFPALERNGFSRRKMGLSINCNMYLEVLLNNPHSQPIFWEFWPFPFLTTLPFLLDLFFGWCFRMTNSFSCCCEHLPHTIAKTGNMVFQAFMLGWCFSGNISSNGWMSSRKTPQSYVIMFCAKKNIPINPHKSHFRLCDDFRPGTSWQCCHFVPQTLIDCLSPTQYLVIWKKWMPCCNFKTGVRATSRITRNQKINREIANYTSLKLT